MVARIKVVLRLIGYAAVVGVALWSGEFAFCVAYGFLLIEAVLHATLKEATIKESPNAKKDDGGIVPSKIGHPMSRQGYRMGNARRSGADNTTTLPAVREGEADGVQATPGASA